MTIKLHNKCNHKILLDYGFKKQKDNCVLILPLYFYNENPVIEVKFTISLEENYVHYDIMNSDLDLIYSPYYDNEYSNAKENKVLKIVKKNL